MESVNVSDRATCEVTRGNAPFDRLPLHGRFKVEHYRNGQLIGRYNVSNAITIEGKNLLLGVMFNDASALHPWYIGLVDNSDIGTPVEGDTYVEINEDNPWNEFTAYVEAARQEWEEGNPSSKMITNPTPAVFNINNTGSVYGLFLAGGPNAATKNDNQAGNTLWSVAAFGGGPVSVAADDQLKVTYTVQS